MLLRLQHHRVQHHEGALMHKIGDDPHHPRAPNALFPTGIHLGSTLRHSAGWYQPSQLVVKVPFLTGSELRTSIAELGRLSEACLVLSA